MALVTEIGEGSKERHSVHEAVECDFVAFVGDDGEKYLQLDTYGSPARKISGKTSQSIQFNQESYLRLIEIGQRLFVAKDERDDQAD